MSKVLNGILYDPSLRIVQGLSKLTEILVSIFSPSGGRFTLEASKRDLLMSKYLVSCVHKRIKSKAWFRDFLHFRTTLMTIITSTRGQYWNWRSGLNINAIFERFLLWIYGYWYWIPHIAVLQTWNTCIHWCTAGLYCTLSKYKVLKGIVLSLAMQLTGHRQDSLHWPGLGHVRANQMCIFAI